MKMKKKNYFSISLSGIFFIVFAMFSLLVVRLGVIQIVNGEQYEKELAKQENSTTSKSVPRGQMFDRRGNVIVGNYQEKTITYTRNKTVKNADMLQVANKLTAYITVDTGKITERDKKDYWIITRKEKADEKLSKDEVKKWKEEGMEDSDIEKERLSRITEEELSGIDEKEMQVLGIFREMKSGYRMTPQVIKNKDVTDEEFARVSEHLGELPGVDTTSDWSRHYPHEDTLRTVLGGVTGANEGLPSNKLDYYLTRDYTRNDRVGKSYIEEQYEDILHGKKSKYKTEMDEDGNVIQTEAVFSGEQGSDLYLTFDIELQKAVEEIITDELQKAKALPGTDLMDRAFAVMMNPKTGEVLSMAGKQIVTNDEGKTEIRDFALGAMTTSYEMGSVVKGATILTGYETGAIKYGQSFYDAPMFIGSDPGIKPKGSWKNFGNINDINALKFSSNVYMFETAIAIGKGNYVPRAPLKLNADVFDTMRYYFSQFGLGVPTGIDLPNETAGFKGQGTLPGFALDLSIGQYDTYSTLQLAQYVSTIANGGYRMKPQILSSIKEPTVKEDEEKKVIEVQEPVVLNRISMSDDDIKRVQSGFKEVMLSGGTGATAFNGVTYTPAGKTGTAETTYSGPRIKEFKPAPPAYNLTMIGYAPFENPEVAFAVAVPWLRTDKIPTSKNIARRITDKYFELQKKHEIELPVEPVKPIVPDTTEPTNPEEPTQPVNPELIEQHDS